MQFLKEFINNCVFVAVLKMTVINLTSENFGKEVVESELPVIIDFYADWCGPCQMLKPIFKNLSEVYDGKLKFARIDTQAEEYLSVQFQISGIPALVVVKDKREIGRIVGYRDEDSLKSEIDKILER